MCREEVIPAFFKSASNFSAADTGMSLSLDPRKTSVGGSSGVMLCAGEIAGKCSLMRECPYPSGPLSYTGLKRSSALGFELVSLFLSAGSSNPLQIQVAAATWPPAEPPPAPILSGSTPSRAALARIQRIADLPSRTQASGLVPCLFLTR